MIRISKECVGRDACIISDDAEASNEEAEAPCCEEDECPLNPDWDN